MLLSKDNSIKLRRSQIKMRRISKVSMILILCGLLSLVIFLLSRINLSFPLHDYLEYWSAGRLDFQGYNPYDPNLLLGMQHSVGWKIERPLMMWNPPWILPILIPFSLLTYSQSRLLWFFTSVGIIVFAANQSWRLYLGSQRKYWIGLIISFLFTPILYTLLLGQSAPWILLGIVGFLLFIDKPKSLWIAGAWAALITIKPQLFYLFFIVLLFWCIENKSWKVLIGCISTIAVGLLIASLFNPDVLLEYIQALFNYPPENFATPTLGFLLRALFGYEKFWLQFLPPSLGVIWLVFYWLKKHSSWNWRNEIPILMFVSIITSPYTWNHDQLILIPALIQASILLLASSKRWKTILIFLAFLIINYVNFLIHQRLDESYTVWVGFAMFGLYIISRQNSSPIPISQGLTNSK